MLKVGGAMVYIRPQGGGWCFNVGGGFSLSIEARVANSSDMVKRERKIIKKPADADLLRRGSELVRLVAKEASAIQR